MPNISEDDNQKISCNWSILYRTVAESLGFHIRSTVGNCLLIRSLKC